MPNFLYVYHGGRMPESKEEGARSMQAWTTWLDGLGEAVVDGGHPVGKSKTMHPGGRVTNDGGLSATSGYSMIKARDIDDAMSRTKGCPLLAVGGTVEVAEIMEMN